jgi:hemoglobin
MYPKHDFAGAEARLRSFLLYRFGGPPEYLRERGHPRLRMRHAPFDVNQAARDRWMQLMMASVDEQQVAPEHRAWLERFLGDIATFLINRA